VADSKALQELTPGFLMLSCLWLNSNKGT